MTTTTASLDLTTGTWAIDPSHTRVGFSAKHAMIAKVRGQFSEFSGSLTPVSYTHLTLPTTPYV